MATRIAYYRALAHRLYDGKYYPITGTGSATTSSTSLKDGTKLTNTDADANAYDYKWVYAMEAADASTRGYSRTTKGTYAAAGTITIGSISGFVVNDLYVITNDPPEVLQDAINDVLRNTYEECFFPLSMHICTSDDNDMETAPATSFDGNKSNATLANETTIVKDGGGSLKITASATGGYTHFGALGVQDGQSLYAAIDMYVTSGDSGTFRIIDVTNSSATVEDAPSDEPSWMELVFQFSVPSDCEQIHARAIADANGDAIYVDNYQIWASSYHVYNLPSWITRPSQVKGVRAFPQGTTGPASDNDYRADEQRSYPISWGFERVNPRADQPLRIWAECGSARPYVFALRPRAELSSDSATSTADEDFVVRWAARLVEAETAEEKERWLGLLRGQRFVRLRTVLPDRAGVA